MTSRRIQKAIFPFYGNLRESYCQITIYPTSESDNVVLVSELEANQGTSAINEIKQVVIGVTQKYKLDPARTTWISHCPEGLGIFLGKEDFHKVPLEWNGKEYIFTNHGGKWDLLSRSEVEQMIGTLIDS